MPPVALTIAGSDPSGGAGIQADLKTFGALGAYGTSVITALTAQNTRTVTGVYAIPEAFVRQQFDTLLSDVRIDAVKIGMLGTASLVDLVADTLTDPRLAGRPVVLDPVMVATSGDRLLDDDAVQAVRRLMRQAHVVTPNLPEAAVLTGLPAASTPAGMREQAHRLRDLGASRVLLKGGHLPGRADAVDLWLDEDGERELTAPRIDTTSTHGTGCSLSSALAALRPRHTGWIDAAVEAKAWLTEAIRQGGSLRVGGGHGPVHHYHEAPRWHTPLP